MHFKTEPYEWQRKAMVMSNHHKHMALLADMGTGKTGAMVNILRMRYSSFSSLVPTLILSPLVTLFNWKDEVLKHSNISSRNIHVIYGTTAQKVKLFERAIKNDPNQIIIMNYEGVIAKPIQELIQKFSPVIAVLDESHYVKNHKAKRSKSVLQLTKNAIHRYIMTGTPMTNEITDLFMQFQILDGGELFGTNFYVFQRMYMYDENAAWAHKQNHYPSWKVREDKLSELYDKIYSKSIRVTKEECLDLPPRIDEVYKIPLSPKQKKYYEQMARDYVTFVEEGNKKGIAVATLAVTKALRLQQIVTGFVTDEDGQVIEIEDNPRLKAVEELILALQAQHKIILWCSFRHNYKQLGRLLTKLGVNHCFITGEMSLEEKREAMDTFNTDDTCRVAICNRKAAGIGVNLVSADYSIVYSRNFSLEEELQSGDRNYRGGSEIHEKIVRINLCAMGTVDEHTTKRLMEKKEVSDSLLEFVKQTL